MSYRGNRTSYYVYHPVYHEHFVYQDIRKNFDSMLKSVMSTADLFCEEMSHHTPIFSQEVRKEIQHLLVEIDKEAERDMKYACYQLEALMEIIMGDRHNAVLPYHYEIKQISTELRARDSGLQLRNQPFTGKPIRLFGGPEKNVR